MSSIRPITVAAFCLTIAACGSDPPRSRADDAGADAEHRTVPDAAQGAGGSTSAEVGGGSGGLDGGVWTFPGSPGLPSDAPFGPNLLGLQDHTNDSGDPSDIAFGIFWDPSVVWVPYVGGGCMAFGTAPGRAGGGDVGVVTVTGGEDGGTLLLTRDPHSGDYFLNNGASNAWSVGDQLSIIAGSAHAGPLKVPTPFASQDLATLGSFTRGTTATIDFSGSNATKVAFSVSASNGVQSLLLACVADAASGHVTIPGGAFAAFPADVNSLDAKLSPVNLSQVGDLAFFAVGESAEATIALQ